LEIIRFTMALDFGHRWVFRIRKGKGKWQTVRP